MDDRHIWLFLPFRGTNCLSCDFVAFRLIPVFVDRQVIPTGFGKNNELGLFRSCPCRISNGSTAIAANPSKN